MLTVPISVNPNVRNKVPKEGMVALQKGFQSKTLCVDDIVNHVLEGHALVPAWMDVDPEGNSLRQNTAFQKAQLVFLDIDNSIKENGVKRCITDAEGYTPLDKVIGNKRYQELAYLIYTSPSHTPEWHRYRIVFCLPEAVRDVNAYRKIVAAFIRRIGSDEACKSPVNIFYGNTAAEVFPYGNVLTQAFVDEVLGWTANLDKEERTSKEHINGSLTKEHAREMLKKIPPDIFYDDWIKIVSALAYHFGEDACVELVEEWSECKEGEVRYRIRKGLGTGRCTIGTVIHYARMYGYNPPAEIYKDGKLEEDAGLIYPGMSYRMTQPGNGERFVEAHKEVVRYCIEQETWYVWDGSRLVRDNGGIIRKMAVGTFREIVKEAANVRDARQAIDVLKWAKASESKTNVEAALYFAHSGTGLAVSADKFDRNPLKINLRNGIFNLQTMELDPHDIDEMHTKIIPIDYIETAECPNWNAFLMKIFNNDTKLIKWMRKAVGYTLTGLTSEECLFFAYGSGANGKSIFFSVVDMLMGGSEGYSHKAKNEMVMMRKGDPGVPMDIAELKGQRFVYTDELPENRRFDENKIKDITSHDRLNGRHIYERSITFFPSHKLWMYGNHRPTITGQDDGIWRRIHLIPFTVKIPKGEQRAPEALKAEFQAEASGILRWALTGYYEWANEGGLYPTPKVIQEATNSYRNEMDTVGMFINEEIVETAGVSLPQKTLYARYKAWCIEKGFSYVMTSNKLSMTLHETKGWAHRIDRKGQREWLGRQLTIHEQESIF